MSLDFGFCKQDTELLLIINGPRPNERFHHVTKLVINHLLSPITISLRCSPPQRPDQFPHTLAGTSHTSQQYQDSQTCTLQLAALPPTPQILSKAQTNRNKPTYLPPIKCLPLKYVTNGFGAVRLTSTSGMNLAPGPEEGGPDSMFHDDGASTDVTGILVSSIALITAGKGSRTSPEKEKPVSSVGRWT